MTDTATSSDLHIERTFDAPRPLVFEAWTSTEHLLNWYGPHDYPAVHWSHEFRPGGAFEFAMRGPDGVEMPGSGEYLEIVENERIKIRSRILDDAGDLVFEVEQTYLFGDAGDGGTTFTLDVDVLVNHDFPGYAGMRQGWTETLERLDTYTRSLI